MRAALVELVRERFEDYYAEEHDEPRNFYAAFFNLPHHIKVRELKTNVVGALVTISGTVTRTSDVRPELRYGRCKCAACGSQTGPVEQQFKWVAWLALVAAGG